MTPSWSEQQLRSKLLSHGYDYLESVTHYIKTGCATAGKRLSFHLDEIECFQKAGRIYEFGGAFQLGRLAGNFVIVSACTGIRMDDKKSFSAMLNEHEHLFGANCIQSIATDKGYIIHLEMSKPPRRPELRKLAYKSPTI